MAHSIAGRVVNKFSDKRAFFQFVKRPSYKKSFLIIGFNATRKSFESINSAHPEPFPDIGSEPDGSSDPATDSTHTEQRSQVVSMHDLRVNTVRPYQRQAGNNGWLMSLLR
jgi:hypothetical protein